MDSLTIQDAFTPYYSGRKRFAAPTDAPAEAVDVAAGREAGKRLLRRVLAGAKSETETGSTTEH